MSINQILTGTGFTWTRSGKGDVPDNAVLAGHQSDGEPLYIGRGEQDGSLTPGKVHRSHGCLYIPFGGAERRIEYYDVLIEPRRCMYSSSRK